MSAKYLYSESTLKMKASKIRELMKYASMPGVISFAGGSPDPENFPFTNVKDIINKWDNKKKVSAMQYGPTPGYQPLIEKLKERMNKIKKIDLANQNLIITSGGQQAIFLLSKIFIDPGDIIIVEQPSFIGAVAAFLSNGAKLVGVPLENDGVNIAILKDKLKKFKDQGKIVKYFYTVPNFQNPAGVTMSCEKRKKLYDISLEYDLVIIEDDPYSDIYFTKDCTQYLPIKSLGNKAPIIYLSSFSKILCPGFRLGWMLGNEEVIDKVSLAKQSIDACSSSFGQVVAYDYLMLNLIDNYLLKMRKIYKEKKDFMIKMIQENIPHKVTYTNPDGGFFLYLYLPENISAEKIFKKTFEEKVAFVTGEAFHIDPVDGDKYIRLSFSNSTYEEIQKGIQVIGRVITESIKNL